MSEQGKTCLACGEWIPRGCGYARCDNCQPEFELKQKLETAETAATEYAQQAAELQEEVGRLRGASLVLAIWVDDVNSSNSNDAINFKELNEAAQRILDLAETETE